MAKKKIPSTPTPAPSGTTSNQPTPYPPPSSPNPVTTLSGFGPQGWVGAPFKSESHVHRWEPVQFIYYARLKEEALILVCLHCNLYTERCIRRDPDLVQKEDS